MNNRFLVPSIIFFGLFLTAPAQDDLFLTLNPAAPVTMAPAGNAVQPPSVLPPNGPVAAPKKETAEGWAYELLRDPFWPIGFFPQDWQQKSAAQGVNDMVGSGWKAAAAKLRISGASRLGDRTAAIINGELKNVGDQITVLHEGRTYQWEIVEIDAAGQIQLKKLGNR